MPCLGVSTLRNKHAEIWLLVEDPEGQTQRLLGKKQLLKEKGYKVSCEEKHEL